MLYDGETFYYENYFYDLQTHEKSISKIVFNSSSVKQEVIFNLFLGVIFSVANTSLEDKCRVTCSRAHWSKFLRALSNLTIWQLCNISIGNMHSYFWLIKP